MDKSAMILTLTREQNTMISKNWECNCIKVGKKHQDLINPHWKHLERVVKVEKSPFTIGSRATCNRHHFATFEQDAFFFGSISSLQYQNLVL